MTCRVCYQINDLREDGMSSLQDVAIRQVSGDQSPRRHVPSSREYRTLSLYCILLLGRSGCNTRCSYSQNHHSIMIL